MAHTAYDQVWEKSDIDLWIVMADDPKVRRYEDHCLTEEGVISTPISSRASASS